MKIWVKKGQYGFSTKLKDSKDESIFMYLDIQFKLENKPEDTCQIDIKDGFFSCYKSKDGIKPKFIVMDYEVIQSNTESETPVEKEKPRVFEATYTEKPKDIVDSANEMFGDDLIEFTETSDGFAF